VQRGRTVGYVECTVTRRADWSRKGFHVHGASRPEGIRPVIPLTLAARIQRSQLASQRAFGCPSIILRLPDATVKNSSRRDATELSLLASDRGDGTRTRKRQVYSTGRVQVGSHEVRAVAVRSLSCASSLLFVQMLCFWNAAGANW
jgi:hypothetical protein